MKLTELEKREALLQLREAELKVKEVQMLKATAMEVETGRVKKATAAPAKSKPAKAAGPAIKSEPGRARGLRFYGVDRRLACQSLTQLLGFFSVLVSDGDVQTCKPWKFSRSWRPPESVVFFSFQCLTVTCKHVNHGNFEASDAFPHKYGAFQGFSV